MKKTLLLLFFSVHFAGIYAQGVTFPTWSINSISPGGTINFTTDVAKGLNFQVTMQKPFSNAVGDSKVFLLVKTTGGSEVDRTEIQFVPTGFWCCGSGTESFSFSTSINYLISNSSTTFKAFLVFVTSSGTEYLSSNSIIFNRLVPPIANAGPDKTIYCPNSTTLNGSASSGTAPYTYSWTPTTGLTNPTSATPTAAPTSSTTYTLTVKDSKNLTATDQVFVNVAPNPSPIIIGASPLFGPCPNKTVYWYFSVKLVPAGVTDITWTSNGNVTGYTYSGSLKVGIGFVSSNLPEARVSSVQASPLIITCTFTYACGSKSTTITEPIAQPYRCSPWDFESLKENTVDTNLANNTFEVFPNPSADGNVSIKFSVVHPGNYSVKVIDSMGKIIESKNLGYLDAGDHSEDMNLQKGGNFIVVITDGMTKHSKRIRVK